ncbi:MAG: NADH-quinone oxidoreductase subunit NuoG [Bacillati bacterium ANGP1]|uniref:NADH-quinone oxidoreductase n=1 Tax=Candidatus Segetimicrobium genomatis TaxID=2569760 RepID=A0A537L9L7_9BACT|nr:MAG: NADH-quinone oxidoreductase subunit NuoG [Terrabacteria group bacterium ANGP1]
MSHLPQTVTLTIDGKAVAVPKGTTVYNAARQVGIEIPIFCYHDRMPPLGACRMCLVKVDKMPKLQTSCTLEAAEGMGVSTTTPDVRAGQEAILEFLLINHPLDCPICDKGGECPLQDQTYAYGPGRSRFIEAKRDFAKPVSLGRVLVLDRERCILCWRCVRFGELVAGDDALKGFERGFHTEINTPFTLPVESKFIGNTIAICPVGALTAKTYRFAARPWDNQTVPSVCTLCGVGCAVEFDVRGGAITRTRAREQPAINDIWLCDLGFFGHNYVHHSERLRTPLIRRDGGLVETTWDEALDVVARRLRAASPSRVAMLGGARLTNEDAYVAGRFFRSVVGTNHLDHRTDATPDGASLQAPWGMASSIAEVGDADTIVLAGCDITEEYPIIWLRMKRAVDRGAAIIAITPKALEIGRFIVHHLVHRYGSGAQVVSALMEAASGASPGAVETGGIPREAISAAGARLAHAARPQILIGRGALDAPDGAKIHAVLRDLATLLHASVNVMRGKGNAFGADLAGLLPHAGPGGRPLAEVRRDLESRWGATVVDGAGLNAPEIIDAAGQGRLDVLYVAAADPATDVPDRARWNEARARLPFLVVQDAFLTQTAQVADVVLPALVAPEKDGTVSNIEGRIQRLHAAVPGPGQSRADWEIFAALAARMGKIIAYSGWEEIFEEMRTLIPGFALDARVSRKGVGDRVSGGGTEPSRAARPLPPEPGPPSNVEFPLILIIGDVLFDRGAMTSRSPAIADLAGEPWALLHPDDASRFGIAEGDATVMRSRRGSVAVRAKLSSAVPPGQVFLPRGYDGAPANALVDLSEPVTRVQAAALAPVAGGSERRGEGGPR